MTTEFDELTEHAIALCLATARVLFERRRLPAFAPDIAVVECCAEGERYEVTVKRLGQVVDIATKIGFTKVAKGH